MNYVKSGSEKLPRTSYHPKIPSAREATHLDIPSIPMRVPNQIWPPIPRPLFRQSQNCCTVVARNNMGAPPVPCFSKTRIVVENGEARRGRWVRIAGGHTRKVCGLYEMERARKAPGRRAEGTRLTRDIALAKNMIDEVREDR